MDLKALYKISYGLYVVCSSYNNMHNGQIANTVFQVTAEPPKIAVSINKQNLTHELIKKSRKFSVSVLSKNTSIELIGKFGFRCGRDFDKFKDTNYKIGKLGIPIVLDHAIAYLEVEVENEIDVGTHTIFVGEVKESEIIRDEEPLTYAYYHEIKKGKSPKTAPTYVEEMKEVKGVNRYRCKICGYIYDPKKGDPDSGIKPGTPFEDLPDNWVCPICGAGKDEFERVE